MDLLLLHTWRERAKEAWRRHASNGRQRRRHAQDGIDAMREAWSGEAERTLQAIGFVSSKDGEISRGSVPAARERGRADAPAQTAEERHLRR
eukprot:637053-Alexandrium_andersonii.AAC.1